MLFVNTYEYEPDQVSLLMELFIFSLCLLVDAFWDIARRDQVAPPTINLDNPDEGCDLNYVAHKSQKRDIQYVLSNSLGFGGTNGTLLFKKFG